MKYFTLDELSNMAGEYVRVIVKVTLITCTAAALNRGMTDGELEQIIDEISAATDGFVAAYKDKLQHRGVSLSKISTISLKEQLNERIMLDTWSLLQKATEEMKGITGYNERIIGN